MRKLGKEDKWLLVSCLQKSIRKGFSDLAVSYADQLYEIERSYLLYRLSIIAVEDVGLGNPQLVDEFLSTEIKKANIEEKGGKDYILSITEKLAVSGKDRSACDLTVLASSIAPSFSFDDSESVFLDNNKDIVDRMLAGWNILGAKKNTNNLVINKEDNVESFLSLNKHLITDERILNIIKNGYKIHREPHFMAMGLLKNQLALEEGKVISKFKTGDFFSRNFDKTFIDNFWLIDGVDWHTKEGKTAIYEFCNSSTETIKYLKSIKTPYNIIPNVIGTLLFRAVGQQVNERLVYPTAVNIMKMVEKNGLEKQLSLEINIKHLNTLFLNDLPLLNEKLHKILSKPDPKHFPF